MVMVLSDNGASAEGGRNGTLNEAAAWMGVPSDVADTAHRLADIGGHDTYNHYPFGWAWAGNGPMRLWKRYAWLGGVRTPLIVRWPAGSPTPARRAQQSRHSSTCCRRCLPWPAWRPQRRWTAWPSSPSTGGRCLPRPPTPMQASTATCSTSRCAGPAAVPGRLEGGHRSRRQPVRRALVHHRQP